ncbi:hypothetical protein ACL00X_06770 [Aeromonas diversa]
MWLLLLMLIWLLGLAADKPQHPTGHTRPALTWAAASPTTAQSSGL